MHKFILAIALILTGLLGHAETTPNAQTEATLSESAAPAPKKWNLNFTQYHYSFKGQDAANTQIYKFGNGQLDMSLLTATYTASADWSFLTFVPYLKNEIETIYEPVSGGLNFSGTDRTQGLGDVRFMAMNTVSLNPQHMTFLDIGFTAPTGSIDEYFTSNPAQRASYNMQLGSGTYDLYLGATVMNFMDSFVSKARLQAAVRTGENKNNWTRGDEYMAQLSSFYQANNWLELGVSSQIKSTMAIKGMDSKYELMSNYVGTQGIKGDGHQYYRAAQTNWDLTAVAKLKTQIQSVTAAAELGVPVAQGFNNKDDVDLNTIYSVSASLSGSF